MLHVPAWDLCLKGEVLGRDTLPALMPAWRDLCGRAVEDNVYYAPRYAEALLRTVERDTDIRFAVVWQGARLLALLPFTRPKLPLPGLRAGGQAWRSDYTFSCTPVLDKFQTREASLALVDVLASACGGEWLLPRLNIEGEACRALLGALAQKGLPWAFLDPFRRASLHAGRSFDEHMETQVDPKRRKDLARNLRRLEKLGQVRHEVQESGEGLQRAVAAFLAIEARGWKGARGTALACRPRTRDFALAAFTGGADASICRADMLTLDGAPVAVSLIVKSGDTGFAVKGAYDEAYRSFSAGLLLEVEVIRSFLTEGWAGRLDAATSGEHVIDCLWPGRVEVADLIFSLSPHRPQARLSALRGAQGAARRMRALAKRQVERMRSF